MKIGNIVTLDTHGDFVSLPNKILIDYLLDLPDELMPRTDYVMFPFCFPSDDIILMIHRDERKITLYNYKDITISIATNGHLTASYIIK